MEQNQNSESRYPPSGDFWENWDGQDSSVPQPPSEPDDPTPWDEADRSPAASSDEPCPAAPDPPPQRELSPPQPPAEHPPDTGFYYRSGAPIPPTHPDHGPMHMLPRQQDGSFAAYYYCSKEELARADVSRPPPRRYRRDGFGVERQQRFVEAYRDTGSLTDAARLTGISRSTAYNLINSADGGAFRAALAEAGKGTDTLLEATAIERAVKGQEEIVYHQGRRVGVRWKYDNRLLMFLLRARNPLKYAPLSEIEGWLKRRGIEPPADVDGALDRLAAAEAEWGGRLPGEDEPPPLAQEAGPRARLPQAGEAAAPAAKSASPGSCEAEAAGAPTSSGSPSDEAACASSSSTSLHDRPVCASTSSGSPSGEAACASSSSISPAAEPPDPGGPIPYRPPPRPRLLDG